MKKTKPQQTQILNGTVLEPQARGAHSRCYRSMKFSPSGNLPSVYLKPYIATHGQFTSEVLAGYLTRGTT